MNRVGFHGTHETQPARMMYLDSSDATHLTPLTSHYTYSFKDAVETGKGEGMLVSLSNASIPYSFYNIREGVNDRLYLDFGSGEAFGLVTPGNYNSTALAAEVVRVALDKGVTLTATFDKTTQKYSFASSSHTVKLFATHDDALAQELGLPSDTVLVVTKDDPAVVAPNVADLNGSVHAIYVRTNLATRSVMESQTGGVSDILAKIDINTDPGGVITLDPNQVSHESLIHTAGVKSIEVRLTDERNRLLDLNGLHSQLGVRFRFVNIKLSEPVATDDRVRIAPQDIQNELDSRKEKKETQRKKALKKGKAIVREKKSPKK
eukprot:COSAG04_NODE_1855_length_5385_cov_4.796443_5_plen_320_part_00